MAEGDLGHPIMAKRKLTQLKWPVKGINEQLAYYGTTGDETLDALNVRNYDSLEERLRGGQRTGQTKLIDAQVNGTVAIQNITQITESIPLSVNAGLGARVPNPPTTISDIFGFELGNPENVTWHPDGDFLAYLAHDDNATGVGIVQEFDPNTGTFTGDAWEVEGTEDRDRLAFSPDGKYLATSEGVIAFDAEAARNGDNPLGSKVDAPSSGVYPVWHPDTTYIAFPNFYDGVLDIFPFDSENQTFGPKLSEPTDDPTVEADVSALTWSNNGWFLAVSLNFFDAHIHVWKFDKENGSIGDSVTDVTNTDSMIALKFRPDDTVLAGWDRSRDPQAWAFDADPDTGGLGVKLDELDTTTNDGYDDSVADTYGFDWHPDGGYFAASTDQGGDESPISVHPWNGTIQPVLPDASTPTTQDFKGGVAWHPSGDYLAYTAEDNNGDIYIHVYAFTQGETNPSALQTRLVGVAGGSVYRTDPQVTNWSLTNQGDGKLRGGNLRIGASVAFQNLFFVDGLADGYHYLDFSDNTVKDWSNNLVAGSLPVGGQSNEKGCRIITTYRGRIVLAGVETDPQNWFMSKAGDPFDFNYSPSTPNQTQAVAGNNSTAGKVGQEITALAPFQDDLMFMAGRSTLWVMRGDPAAGGQIDNISRNVGIVGSEAFAWSTQNIFYFFGLNGLYRMAPGGLQPEHISVNRLDETFSEIDTANNEVRLVYDAKWQGVHIFVSPVDEPDIAPNHYWYDERTNSFWRDQYPTAHGPTAVEFFSADVPDRRGVILGGYDGYVRRFDPNAKDDDGTAIMSRVQFPVIAPGGVFASARIDDTYILTDQESDDVTFKLYAGHSAERVAKDAANDQGLQFKATIEGGRNNPLRRRVSQNAFVPVIEQTAMNTNWAYESGGMAVALLNRMKGKRVT